MNQQTISSLTEIQNRFPDAAYYTPGMIAAVIGHEPHTIRYYCRKLFPQHEGYYRFWSEPIAGGLDKNDLDMVLKTINQAIKKA